jgi:hypothetical protein
LDEGIYERYMSDDRLPLDCGEGVPLEFTFGAFRFGHALVRDKYRVNNDSQAELPTSAALNLSSQRFPDKLPVERSWFVDWAYFFEIKETLIEPNRARAIGPSFGDIIADQNQFMRSTLLKAGGLPNRDLVSAAYAGMLSVPTLCRNARDRGFDKVEDFSAWRPRLQAWLTSTDFLQPDDERTRQIADDPPLPFFVLFEAARIGRSDEADGGQRLGPLGSVIVAEAIFGAMRRHRLGVEGPNSTLKQRIEKCASLLLDFLPEARDTLAQALSQIDEIETMPQLLRYMKRQGLFAPL